MAQAAIAIGLHSSRISEMRFSQVLATRLTQPHLEANQLTRTGHDVHARLWRHSEHWNSTLHFFTACSMCPPYNYGSIGKARLLPKRVVAPPMDKMSKHGCAASLAGDSMDRKCRAGHTCFVAQRRTQWPLEV